MSSDSDRPIEKQLRDYAARRGSVAGKDAFALHPVTRNALHVEVEREYGKRSRLHQRPGGAPGGWPRWIWAGGFAALVGVVALGINRYHRSSEPGNLTMAKLDDGRASTDFTAHGAKSESVSVATDNPATKDALAVSTGALAAGTSASGRQQEFRFVARQQAMIAMSAEAAPPPPELQSNLPRRESRAGAPQVASNPTLAPRPAAAPRPMVAAALPLQGAFRVTILDGRMSIVDADQSSYSGRLEPIDPVSVGAAAPNRSLTFEERYYKFMQNGVEQHVPVAARFSLTGTNRTTRLSVQIVGQMITQTQAVPAKASVTAATDAVSVLGAGVFLKLQGTATVNGRQIQIDASTLPQ